ncbi:hypothetical protein GJAV_G00069240 [Gymnothorax javanicus]|nr:hypothetical protein GJAV_G00069240 [Gymnothorax javanicus]
MGNANHKDRLECNRYLNGKGPPPGLVRAHEDRRGESAKRNRMVGDQPEGEMKWISIPRSLPCYPHCGTIEIEYDFKDGVQLEVHPNPGRPFTGLRAVAYLPDDLEGQKLLELLRQAFEQRLSFTVATGSDGSEVVTWSDIPHCTGFSNPDPHYIMMAKQALKSKVFYGRLEREEETDFQEDYITVRGLWGQLRPRRTNQQKKKCRRGFIHIFFEFEDGIQEDTHPNPGMPYTGLKTIAYLPDNTDGQKVVTRLKKAFDQRVVFTIQRNGKGEDTVVPSDIPLKTYCDTSGPSRLCYPDSTYLKSVKKMLKSRGFH